MDRTVILIGLQLVLGALGLIAFAVGITGDGGWGLAAIPLAIAAALIFLLELPKRGR